jgi:signal peptidase II
VFNQQTRRWLVPLLVIGVVLVSDQLTKHWILQELGPEPLKKPITLIGDWVRFIYSQNTGVAFNLFQGLSSVFIFTSLLIAIGAAYIYWVYLPHHSPLVQVSFGLIEGGALGNTIDRIRFGFVVDFIQVGWWPVFNIADSAITIGAITLGSYIFLVGDPRLSEEEREYPRDEALLGELLETTSKPEPPREHRHPEDEPQG